MQNLFTFFVSDCNFLCPIVESRNYISFFRDYFKILFTIIWILCYYYKAFYFTDTSMDMKYKLKYI